MKFLNLIWPWSELYRLREEVEFLKRTLEHEQTSHNLTRASLQDHKLELIDHKSRNTQSQKDIRKLATILAMRGGITLILLFLSFSASGQPILRQLFTTNTPPIISSISGPMVTTNGSGAPELTYNGGGLTNIPGVAVAQGTNIITRTNGQVVTVNGVTDTNVINILLAGATNQSTVVSNGVVAHTVTVAGTANQITSSVGTAQTIAANPATTLSLPDPVIAPGKVSGNIITNRDFSAIGVVTNDANGKLYTTPILDPALVNFTPATNQSTVVSNGLVTYVTSATNHGTFWIYGGGTLNALAANTTNFISINGVVASVSGNSTTPMGLTCALTSLWVVNNANIGASTNVTYEVFTNGLAATTLISTGLKAIATGNQVVGSSAAVSIPMSPSYGLSIGEYANGTALASQFSHWAIKVEW